MSVSPVCSCLSCPTHAEAGRPAACGFYPSSSLTDAQVGLLGPLLPPPGNSRRPRGAAGEARPPPGAGCDLLSGPRRHLVAGAAGGVPAVQDRLRHLPPL